MQENEPPYYAEIDQVLEPAVAAINQKLAAEDEEADLLNIEPSPAIKRAEPLRGSSRSDGLDEAGNGEADYAPAQVSYDKPDPNCGRLTNIQAPAEESVKKKGDGRMSVEAERAMRVRLEEITVRAMTYDRAPRLDVGYLLEVINAYETGKL